MFSFGLVVALGLLVILAKLDWKKRIWMFSHPLTMDLSCFVVLTLLHWGTFSGVMVATVGALFTSITMSVGKWLFGYIVGRRYFPGRFNVVDKLR